MLNEPASGFSLDIYTKTEPFSGQGCTEIMIEKIISGGRTGAGRAALDAAMKLGIAHGGWVLNGKMTEDGPLSDKYDLKEMPDQNHSERTKNNIKEACGTLILSHGKFREHFDFIKKMSERFSKPMLHVDLQTTIAFNAATLINDWIVDNDIRILNVTGPRDERDPKIYQATLDIIQAVFFLNLTETNMSNPIHAHYNQSGESSPASSPKTVADAVDIILSDMSLKNRSAMANLREQELPSLQLTLGLYIKRRLDQWPHDEAFTASCIAESREEGMDESNLTIMMIKKLWKKLKETHRLRVVK